MIVIRSFLGGGCFMSWEATPSIASSSSNDNWDYIMLAGWGRTKPSTAVASTGGEDAMVKLRRNTAYRRGRGGRRQRWKRRNRWNGGEDITHHRQIERPVSHEGQTTSRARKNTVHTPEQGADTSHTHRIFSRESSVSRNR